MHKAMMAVPALAALLLFLGNAAIYAEDLLFPAPSDSDGGLIPSSWVGQATPTATDSFAYGSFVVSATGDIREIRWRGGYIGGDERNRVVVFVIRFYTTNYLDMPDVTSPYGEAYFIKEYNTGGNAEETPAGAFGGVAMYDYRYTLDPPFPAYMFSTYWVKIEAVQVANPNWGIAAGLRGQHYSFTRGWFTKGGGQLAFSLLGKKAPDLSAPGETAAATSGG